MRKLLISLLLASAAATPALADPGDHHNHDNNRPEHSQTRAERPQRSESMDRQRGNGGERQNFARTQGFQQNGQQNVQQQQALQVQAFRAERQRMQAAESSNPNSAEDRRELRRNRQGFNGRSQQVTDESLRQADRPVPNVLRTRNRTEVVSEIPRRGTQPPLRVDNNHRRDRVNWNTDWRHDGRYDWRNWRNHHRSHFHLGYYYDPFGWGYQPYGIGWRLWPNYYSSNYWINDPYQYRLPFAPPGTQWIRYYNDALLVDTYTGEVVDVIRNFFW